MSREVIEYNISLLTLDFDEVIIYLITIILVYYFFIGDFCWTCYVLGNG